MANMRALRMRIKSLQSTQQVTKSMKMVSAAKLRRSQNAYSRLKSFAEKSNEILRDVVNDTASCEHPLLAQREPQKSVCYVLVVGNRGLCGTYNQSVLRFLTDLVEQDPRESFLVVCGRWGREAVEKTGIRIERWFDEIDDVPDSASARSVSAYLKDLYVNGRADEIVLVYQQYGSVLSQNPAAKTLLPVKTEESGTSREYIFEPNRENVLENLISLYIDNTVHAILLEAKTSEHAARMMAMTSASDNASELIDALRLKLNHARQAAITTEIAEISGGAAVLEKEKD